MDLISFCFGAGIIGLLFQISRDLGAIKATFENIKEDVTDHGVRITKLEETVHEKLA